MTKPTKAALYLERLDGARCDGQWDEVPELVRKVRKHAPDRSCIATTAETEYAIIKASQKPRPASRPTTAVSSSELDAPKFLARLLTAIEAETTYLQDKFQAQVCVGWLHWTVGEYEIASARLPGNLEQEVGQLDQTNGPSEWTKVCALKAAYLKANCLSRSGHRVEALAIFESALVSSSHVWDGQKGRTQLRFWAELFLTEYCMLQAQALERGEKSLEDADSLAPFRAWARYWDTSKTQGTPPVGGHGFRGAVPRRRVWNEYYAALSGILQQDLPYPTGYLNATNEASARSQLRMELKKVETTYEGLLLNETSFPRADEEREEVETFVAAVMRNWSVLSGRGWHEQDLGAGGKESLSRGVLDILYRAATKTFHSTAILRHLFTLHLSVAEFDLAFHALDSYLEIVKKGKARIDKTGHVEPSLDDDATVLETMVKAITALCRYGNRQATEKARDLGVELESMLEKLPKPLPKTGDGIPTLDEENGDGEILHPRLSVSVYALAWQGIGLAQAQWSRATYDAPARTEIQAKAIRSLHKSLSPDNGNPTDIRALFTLGLLLAERRELTAAIDIVKAALVSNKTLEEQTVDTGSYWRERSLIPLWHLLALLLSARQDFIMAARACEGAFEQFRDPSVLFGSQDLQGTYRSEHLNEMEAKGEMTQPKGLVDDMDDLEKEGIIEIKMTQLALLELLEGPEVAVNASHELLVLYTRLFETMQSKALATTQSSALEVPKSSAGTLRSIRGSIFGSKSKKSSRQLRRGSILDTEIPATIPERPQTAQTAASTSTGGPTIQVTEENGDVEDKSSTRPTSVRGRRSESARRSSLKKRDSSAQKSRRAVSNSGASREPSVTDSDAYFSSMTDGAANEHPDFFTWSSRIKSQPTGSRGRGLLRFDSTQSGPFTGSDVLGFDASPAYQSLPTIQFPDALVKRQRQTLLVKVWLMIGSFYRRSRMYGDAQGSIGEAWKLVEKLEFEVAKDSSGSMSSQDAGWGGKKSVEELWGDMQTEKALLAMAEGVPFVAQGCFEEALMHYPNHPRAIVGLSNILLDIYSEDLVPPPSIPSILAPDGESAVLSNGTSHGQMGQAKLQKPDHATALPTIPLGLGAQPSGPSPATAPSKKPFPVHKTSGVSATEELPAPHKAKSLPLLDRLAARDRAYGLLSGLTKLGTGWNYSEAWFALARAHEESGQPEKAKDALWWCVELEEGLGVREWDCVGINGYAL